MTWRVWLARSRPRGGRVETGHTVARPRRDPTGFRHVVVNILGKVPRTDGRAKAEQGAEWGSAGRAGRATRGTGRLLPPPGTAKEEFMTTRVTLISPAAGDAQREVRFDDDAPLSEAGLRRVRAVAGGLPAADRALVSPSVRCRRTAAELGLSAESAHGAGRLCDG